jgi:hypothetical protein
MTDVARRVEDMDRVGIDVEVVSLSTPTFSSLKRRINLKSRA